MIFQGRGTLGQNKIPRLSVGSKCFQGVGLFTLLLSYSLDQQVAGPSNGLIISSSHSLFDIGWDWVFFKSEFTYDTTNGFHLCLTISFSRESQLSQLLDCAVLWSVSTKISLFQNEN